MSSVSHVRRFALAWCASLCCLACSRVSERESDTAPTALRVVPTSATAVDFVHALIDPTRVVAIPSQALEYSSLHDDPTLWRSVPRFDVYLAEPILALEPDLVLVDPWQAPETTQRLRSFGIRVVELPQVAHWADARAALLFAARALDAEPKANELVAELDRRVAELGRRANSRPKRTVLCYSNFGGAGSSAGVDTTVHSMFEIIGLDNLVTARGHVPMTFESLLTLDPDVIVVSRPLKMGEGPAGDRGGASEKLLLSEPSLTNLRAVRERRIVSIPAWLFATGSHELVSGAEELERCVLALFASLEETKR